MLYRDDAAVLSPRCGFCVLLGSRVTILMLDTEEGRGATSRRGRTGRVSLVNEGSQQSSFSVGKAAPGEKISAARGAGASDLLCLELGRLATSRRGGSTYPLATTGWKWGQTVRHPTPSTRRRLNYYSRNLTAPRPPPSGPQDSPATPHHLQSPQN